MANLIVEDGSGLENADAYADVDVVDAYFESLGEFPAWRDSLPREKNQAIRVATKYLDRMYGYLLGGHRTYSDQALQWPRSDAEYSDGTQIPSNEVPTFWKEMMAEGALIERDGQVNGTGGLFPRTATGAVVMKEKKKIGDLETDVEYAEGRGDDGVVRFPHLDDIFNDANGGGLRMELA